MPDVATVKELLDSLDYGKTTAEHDILDALRGHFKIPAKANLNKALKKRAAGEVLTAILELLKPFAFMILDIYGFLADAAVRTEGNLEVHVPLKEAEKLKLDLGYFRQFEQAVIGSVISSGFDPGLLPSDGQWRGFHDQYWPPDCALEPFEDAPPFVRCSACPQGTLAEDFRRFRGYFEQLDQIAAEQLALPEHGRWPSAGGFGWDSIRGMWTDCKRRGRRSGGCSMENEWIRTFFRSALSEFDSATRSVSVGDVRRFLALPYWRQRWQFYEVWFLTLVLRSYGLPNLTLRTVGRDWTLAVGSVDPKPIATSQLASGERVDFYYQYQGIPPSPLFPGSPDRPEMLIQQESTSPRRARILLVAEVKARKNFGMQDMKGALYALQEWNPEAIIGANYFSMGGEGRLVTHTHKETEIVAADECAPRSETAQELLAWLGAFWKRKLGGVVSVVLIDTSGSMPAHLMPKAIDYIRRQLQAAPTTDVLIATFSDSTLFVTPKAFDDGSLDTSPRGGTALAKAVQECRRRLSKDFPGAGRFSVHILTDLNVESRDLDELIQWAASENTAVRIYTWPGDTVGNWVKGRPDLKSLIELVPS